MIEEMLLKQNQLLDYQQFYLCPENFERISPLRRMIVDWNFNVLVNQWIVSGWIQFN